MTIDTHVHFWKYQKDRDGWMKEMKILQQNYLPENISLTLSRNGIDGCIAVQADQSELETHFLTELANTHPLIKGVVGWVDLQAANIAERLFYFSQYPVIKGWRHIAQGEAADFLLGKNFQRGIAALKAFGYTYDILIYHHQLPAAVEFVSAFPDQAFMLDHCAKPDIKNRKIDDWKMLMREMANHPNVYCKVSGLFTEAAWRGWTPAEFYPYLDVVFEAFGIDRVVYGSDWPVILVAGIYVQWKSLLEKYMEQLPEEDRQKFFGENGNRFYGF